MATRSLMTAAGVLAASALLAACGEQQVSLDSADQTGNTRVKQGAEIFADKCAGCHTLAAAGTQGSATKVRNRERTDGPNFDTRREDRNSVLYAIRNGGFSGAIMPENIVVGDDAEKVADFLAKYAGREAKNASSEGRSTEAQPDKNGPDQTSGGATETPTNPGQDTGSSDEQNAGGSG